MYYFEQKINRDIYSVCERDTFVPEEIQHIIRKKIQMKQENSKL